MIKVITKNQEGVQRTIVVVVEVEILGEFTTAEAWAWWTADFVGVGIDSGMLSDVGATTSLMIGRGEVFGTMFIFCPPEVPIGLK